MTNVTLHLQADAVRSLAERAQRGGQTLETYLEQLVERHSRAGNGSVADHEEADEDQLAERPWRGVFVPPRPRDVLFSEDISAKPGTLPKRQPSLNMGWHRLEEDHE